jgi:hypothetical protein
MQHAKWIKIGVVAQVRMGHGFSGLSRPDRMERGIPYTLRVHPCPISIHAGPSEYYKIRACRLLHCGHGPGG